MLPLAIERLIRYVAAIPAHIVDLFSPLVTPDLLGHFHAAGVRVLTGPLDDEAQMTVLFAIEPDLMLTNRPDVWMEVKRRMVGAG